MCMFPEHLTLCQTWQRRSLRNWYKVDYMLPVGMLIVSSTNVGSIQSDPGALTIAGKSKNSQQSGAHIRQWLVEHFWPSQPVEGPTRGYTSDSMRSESLIFSPFAVLVGVNPKKDQYPKHLSSLCLVSRPLSILGFPVSDNTTLLELAPQSTLAHVPRSFLFSFKQQIVLRMQNVH